MTRALLVPALALLAGAHAWSATTVEDGHVQHVLLISVDGMHAIDLQNWVAANPTSNLAKLSAAGITYTNALTGGGVMSDSFPGLAALVTGGFPGSTGLWYDDSWDRSLYLPGNTLPGIETTLFEALDYDFSYIDGGATFNGHAALYDATAIDQTHLPVNGPAGGTPPPVPVWPHQIQRLNTIFEVVKGHGMYTAWCDKHPAYEWVMGPSGAGLNDFYAPEINSFCLPNGTPQPTLAVAGSGITGTYAGTPVSLAAVNPNGQDLTSAEAATQVNDSMKVAAIINQIDGTTALGNATVPTAGKVPNLFGMNFQALSVAQKLRHDPLWGTANPGGYTSASAAPSAPVTNALTYVDAQIGSMITELTNKGLYNSTLMIITAKHGQSPIDVTKLAVENATYSVAPVVLDPIASDGSIANVAAGATVPSGIQTAFSVSDDIYLIWLQNQSQLGAAVALLEQNTAAFNIQTIYSGATLQARFHVVAGDPRAPDIIIQPTPGTIYNSGKKKVSEHGGASPDDLHVALLLSTPGLAQATVTDQVLTTSVAATIVQSLGIPAATLESTTVDGTTKLAYANATPAPAGGSGNSSSSHKCGGGSGLAALVGGLLAFFGLRFIRRRT
jgi:arylsulfatase A-like enzyme